jgi:hypothetical protein
MKKLLLDTNICGTLVSPEYSLRLPMIKARISRRFKVVVSPHTFIELLDALTKSSSSHFEDHKARLRIMAGGGKPVFLPFPGAFALKRVLGLESPATTLGPVHFHKWFRIMLRADSLDDLIAGAVKDPLNPSKTYRMDSAEITRQLEEGKAEHKHWLKSVQDGRNPIPTGPQWAGNLARDLRWELTADEAVRLHQSLDAAYEYHKELRRVANQKSYNPDKHAGDWIDYHQLFYLCDPEIILVTGDKTLLNRVSKSSQKDRILLLEPLLRELGL